MFTNQAGRRDREGRSAEAGIAILEYGVSALIVAAVVAFALPAVSNSIRAYNLRSAANHVAERMSAVRALAMAKNRNVAFAFNAESGRYGFDFDEDGVPDVIDPDEPEINYYVGNLPSGIAAELEGDGPLSVTFNSRGELPIGATEQDIALTNSNGIATVSVNLRGSITVH